MMIKKAVIPVAGLGTRMLPATKAIPKEMLPPPTEYRGKKVFFDGGAWIDETGKKVDFKR